MKIIISPAKKMTAQVEYPAPTESPVFLERTKQLMQKLQSLSYEELKKLWVCNDEIASQNVERLQHMDLQTGSAALVSYVGIQYQYMAPQVFEDAYYEYVQEHLRILSGFYGIVRPLDRVTPYRLEMQAKLAMDGHRNLYSLACISNR